MSMKWKLKTCRHSKQKKNLQVYIDGWTVQKSLLHEQKLQKPLEIPICK